MMARGSKDSEKPKNWIGKKFAYGNFGLKTARGSPDFFFSRPTQARKHETENRWISKTNRI